jgi:hypothetical protein
VSARVSDSLVVVQGAIDDADGCLAALQRWLQRSSTERLLPLLGEQSVRTGLNYRRASVRAQRSRWGSCSSNGSISLNRCLLFLPPELMQAVMLHELAHLRHANHSRAFWRLVEQLDPEATVHRRALARGWDAEPPWAEP